MRHLFKGETLSEEVRKRVTPNVPLKIPFILFVFASSVVSVLDAQ